MSGDNEQPDMRWQKREGAAIASSGHRPELYTFGDAVGLSNDSVTAADAMVIESVRRRF
jgi:hypothetical protein